MTERYPTESLLALDPDLGQLVSPERLEAARRDLPVRVLSVDPGEWQPDHLSGLSAANVGLLVVDGVLAREIRVHDAPSAELLGPGDIIRTWQADPHTELLRAAVRWTALGRASFALLDRRSALALRAYPEIMLLVLDRLNARTERLAITQAISQITGVDTRVETLLWHLAERWGRVSSDGVVIPIELSHRMIGSLVGARRPTVSTALSRLAELDRVTRRADGTWLLRGASPLVPDQPRSAQPWPAERDDALAATLAA